MARGLLGIVAGYIIFAGSAVLLFLISRHDPHAPASSGFLVFSVVYGIVFAFLAGYVAAAIAGLGGMLYAMGVAIAIAAGALVSLIARPGKGAIWSQVAALLLMAPAALVGGYVRTRQRQEVD
jgi:hypothetical protein